MNLGVFAEAAAAVNALVNAAAVAVVEGTYQQDLSSAASAPASAPAGAPAASSASAAAPAGSKLCAGCGCVRARALFSTAQLRKKGRARCGACVATRCGNNSISEGKGTRN